MPFLLHNTISFDGTHFRHFGDPNTAYKQGGLCHIKMALQKIGLGDIDDPVLVPFREAVSQSQSDSLTEFVECCAVYLLAGAFGNIKADIAARFSGEVVDDHIAINMAVPVADADHPQINNIFDRVLRQAWVLSGELAGHPRLSMSALRTAIECCSHEANTDEIKDACFIYPEVSANVQGFVRSRNSSTGLYLFSDTGAGTVDQSVFLLARPNGQDLLTYLHAEVFPLGSSHIERLAADACGDSSWQSLERWRQMKESGGKDKALSVARSSIHEQLCSGTVKTIACAKEKLIRRNQINQIRMIFGGGGHCEYPYRDGVMKVIDHAIFRQDEINDRRRKRDLFDIGMPDPKDLVFDQKQKRWMNRLSVAYGLSFEKGQLATFKLPRDVKAPTPDQVWRPQTPRRTAVSKDDV